MPGSRSFSRRTRPTPRAIANKAIAAMRARLAARKARELTGASRRSTARHCRASSPTCSIRDPEAAELFIVEGDSAGGSAKQGRDRTYQAILPLRGKIINSEKNRINKVLSNNEIQAMITAIGTGIGDEFDIEVAALPPHHRHDRRDVDGSHIRTLVLTFLYRHMKELFERGTSTSPCRRCIGSSSATRSTTSKRTRSSRTCSCASASAISTCTTATATRSSSPRPKWKRFTGALRGVRGLVRALAFGLRPQRRRSADLTPARRARRDDAGRRRKGARRPAVEWFTLSVSRTTPPARASSDRGVHVVGDTVVLSAELLSSPIYAKPAQGLRATRRDHRARHRSRSRLARRPRTR